jgi:hypothetical protein
MQDFKQYNCIHFDMRQIQESMRFSVCYVSFSEVVSESLADAVEPTMNVLNI